MEVAGVGLPVADSCQLLPDPPARSRRVHAPTFFKATLARWDGYRSATVQLPQLWST